MAGVTPNGFVIKLLEEIVADINSKARSDISPSINTTSASLFGQLTGVFAEELEQVWEVLAALDGAISPETSAGVYLDRLAAQYGITRKDATFSTASIRFIIPNAVTVPAGTQVTNANGDPIFETIDPFTNTGPIGQFDILSQATVPGPLVAPAGTLNVAVGALPGGVSLINNPNDAIPGTNTETDAEFRQRFFSELQSKGSGTRGSIEGCLLALNGINCANVYENTLGVCNSGIPPCSIEVVVWDPGLTVDPDEIAQCIYDKLPLGVYASGPEVGDARDKNNQVVPIRYSYVLEREIWLEINAQLSAGPPSDAEDQLIQAAVDYASSVFSCGDDISTQRIECELLEFPWVNSVEVLVGFSALTVGPGPLEIDPREVGTFDTSRVAVNV